MMKRTTTKCLVLVFLMLTGLGLMLEQSSAARSRHVRPWRRAARIYSPVQKENAPQANAELAEIDEVTEKPDADTVPPKTEETTVTGKTVEKESTTEKAAKEIKTKSETSENTETSGKEESPLEVEGLPLTPQERQVYELTNQERTHRGLPPLKLSRLLVESARRHASWMARTGAFQHGHSGFAENIAMGQPSGFAVVRAWMNSTGHMRNMLNRGHGCIGIGVFVGHNGRLYWCQQFSR
ncbi:MAG: CAP domain-containing protein [Planctomycetaceae bacterium]|jgi:uncharacterized protein YkwD|nr:CAP domain-containing protein [Planctomycetaceae bacterium]